MSDTSDLEARLSTLEGLVARLRDEVLTARGEAGAALIVARLVRDDLSDLRVGIRTSELLRPSERDL